MTNLLSHIILRLISSLLICLAMTFLIAFFFEWNPYIIFGTGIMTFLLVFTILLRKLLSPLKIIINRLRKINLSEEYIGLTLPHDVEEYHELINELEEYSSLTKDKYLYHRQYSENLSHELLTPLAVIRAKAELILQNPNLRETDLLSVDSILQTVSRLSKINQSLILLSKIDNNQFVDEEEVNLKELINDALENFEDQIRKKHISVRIDVRQDLTLLTNLNLMHILILNLIKNSVFHNIEEGMILVRLDNKSLSIKNTGVSSEKDTKELFKRFVSREKNANSIGLGLSIVKQICSFLEFGISYKNEDIYHEVVLTFQKKYN